MYCRPDVPPSRLGMDPACSALRVAAALVAALVLLAAPGLGAVAEEPLETPFIHLPFHPVGSPDLEIFDDFDGNGVRDVLLCDNRSLCLFLGEKDSFPDSPTHRFEAPDDAAFIDVIDSNGDGARDIVVVKSTGIFVLEPGPEPGTCSERLLVPGESDLIPPRVARLSYVNFATDITGDYVEDLVFTTTRRFIVHACIKKDEEGKRRFEKWGEIPYTPRAVFTEEPLSDTGRFTETISVPQLMAQGPRDDRTLIFYDGAWVRILKRTEGLLFAEASARNLFENVADEKDALIRFPTNVRFVDLDRDGRGDLVVFDNQRGEVRFYRGVDAEQPDKPDFSIRVKGQLMRPVLTDLNKDGLRDLILPNVGEIGLFTALKVFIASDFDLTVQFFFNRGEGLFRTIPDETRTLSLPLSFATSSKGINVQHMLIYSFRGDFNGDKRCDLLLRGKGNKLNVFFGQKDGSFSDEPDMDFEVEILPSCFSVRTRIIDLNRDGISDLFLYQRASKIEENRYDLYLSKPLED